MHMALNLDFAQFSIKMFISKRLLWLETRRLMFKFLERIYSLFIFYAIYNVLYMKVLYIYEYYHKRSFETHWPLCPVLITMSDHDLVYVYLLNVCHHIDRYDPRTSRSYDKIIVHSSINNINNYNLTLLIYSLQDLILQLLFINIQLL